MGSTYTTIRNMIYAGQLLASRPLGFVLNY